MPQRKPRRFFTTARMRSALAAPGKRKHNQHRRPDLQCFRGVNAHAAFAHLIGSNHRGRFLWIFPTPHLHSDVDLEPLPFTIRPCFDDFTAAPRYSRTQSFTLHPAGFVLRRSEYPSAAHTCAARPITFVQWCKLKTVTKPVSTSRVQARRETGPAPSETRTR